MIFKMSYFRTQSSRGRIGGGKLDEDFLEEYNHLRWLERDTTRNMAAVADKMLTSAGTSYVLGFCDNSTEMVFHFISLR